jgi:class 3 adenylate cyclase
MPNFDLAKGLRLKYKIYANNSTFPIRESFSFDLKKSFDLLNVSQDIIDAFEKRQSFNIVTIYIDITKFSLITQDLQNDEIVELLEEYYKIAIPIIYKYGGEIEKIMGDGIIAVFGKPFLSGNKNELLVKAEKTCKKIIKEFKGTKTEVKCALHDGKVFYLKCGYGSYYDYTIVGKVITELFRLESKAKNNSITFYAESPYDKLIESKAKIIVDQPRALIWYLNAPKKVSLRGVDYEEIRSLEYIEKSVWDRL